MPLEGGVIVKKPLIHETTRLHLDPLSLIHGIVLSFICMGILSLVLGTLGFYLAEVEKRADLLVLLAGLASAGFGAAVAARRVGEWGWLHGSLAGIGFILFSYPLGLIWAAETVVTSVFLYRLLGGLAIGALGGMIGVSL